MTKSGRSSYSLGSSNGAGYVVGNVRAYDPDAVVGSVLKYFQVRGVLHV